MILLEKNGRQAGLNDEKFTTKTLLVFVVISLSAWMIGYLGGEIPKRFIRR
jgi:hypothetical protein